MDEGTVPHVLLHCQTQVHCVKKKNMQRYLENKIQTMQKLPPPPQKSKTVLEMGIQLLAFSFLFS
jgi:hypothetical protein